MFHRLQSEMETTKEMTKIDEILQKPRDFHHIYADYGEEMEVRCFPLPHSLRPFPSYRRQSKTAANSESSIIYSST